ncbi:hypothetical protein [Natrinema soli]|uniref:Uncharacterized protein n=1 Tax=Natrinema soli TaxID=1930624 RepID=A0ABD5SSN9_9EURY|nr:hypothetical protein [Natrinema soli]
MEDSLGSRDDATISNDDCRDQQDLPASGFVAASSSSRDEPQPSGQPFARAAQAPHWLTDDRDEPVRGDDG